MGKVTILDFTTKEPITMIGKMSGVCYGSNVKDELKNFQRGMANIESQHGRTWEFPDVYMELDGYSARVIREWYTHIGGAPTRVQASTRCIDYKDFDCIIPATIDNNEKYEIYYDAINQIKISCGELARLGVPKEDIANILPLGITTKIVDKRNLRNLVDMSHQRMCKRAYWEYREMFKDICDALTEYSEQWKWLVDNLFMPKCKYLGKCPESKSCLEK